LAALCCVVVVERKRAGTMRGWIGEGAGLAEPVVGAREAT